jgi:hypothetical protein
MMSIDMSEIERKVFMVYNEDGLVDIALGFVFLGWGVLLVVGPPFLITLLGPIALGIWYFGNRLIAAPRVGLIEPGEKMANRNRNLAVALLFLGVLAFVGILIGVLGGSSALDEYALGLVGLVAAGGVCVLAYLLQANRLYAYAALLFVAFAGGVALAERITVVDAFLVSIIVAGALIIVSGLVVLARFLRRYPLPVEEA